MNTALELQLRLQQIESSLSPEIKVLKEEDVFRNADNTGDDNPKVGDNWKQYWQIFTQKDFPTACPFCGKLLAEDEVSGCHINIRRINLFPTSDKNKYSFTNKKYIIPGHQRCNKCTEDENEFNAKIEIIAVEAIKK